MSCMLQSMAQHLAVKELLGQDTVKKLQPLESSAGI